jgi:anti-sigma B factor antagonist
MISSDREGGTINVASTFRGVLTILVEQQGTELVLRVSGELDHASAGALDDELRRAIGEREAVVLDLGEVTMIDSTGLRVLVLAAKQSALNGTRLKIVRVTERVRNVFELTGLDHALPLAD